MTNLRLLTHQQVNVRHVEADARAEVRYREGDEKWISQQRELQHALHDVRVVGIFLAVHPFDDPVPGAIWKTSQG